MYERGLHYCSLHREGIVINYIHIMKCVMSLPFIPISQSAYILVHPPTYSYFTWDKTRFPTPANMITKLVAKGRKMVGVIDPHLKQDKFHIYDEAKDGGHLVVDKNNKVYEGWCWPGIIQQ